MTSAQVVEYCWLAYGVLLAVWAVLLFRLRLTHRYPLATAFFLVGIFQVAAGFLMTRNPQLGLASHSYAWFWILSNTVTWTLCYCVLIEIYKQMLAGYEGFRRLGQLFLFCGLAASMLFVLTLVWLAPPNRSGSWMALWALEERSVYTALTVLSLLLVSFGVYFRLHVSRDVLVLLGVFGFMFGGQAALWALRGFWGESFRPVRNIASPVLVITCLSAGAWILARVRQQEQPAAFATAGDAQAAHLLSARLRDLNETLQKLLGW